MEKNLAQLESQGHRERLQQIAKEATQAPGVYLMKNADGEILYVGKAKNLRNRIATYFQTNPHESARIELLVTQLESFDVILTETETEALILECTLIKRHKPKFNVRLKDDKAYPYIKVDLSSDFPYLEWTRRVKRDGARYFGPFPSAWSARQVMQLLNETLKLRDCSENAFRHRTRPCILHSIGRCSAPCVGKITGGDYRASVLEAVTVLEGKGERLITNLERGMQDASQREEFEQAAQLRDQIKHLRLVLETQSVIEIGRERNRDVIGIARDGNDAHGVILEIRNGKLISVKHYDLQNTQEGIPSAEVIEAFIAQHLALHRTSDTNEDTAAIESILVPEIPDQCSLLEGAFSTAVCVAETDADRQLLSAAQANATYALELKKKRSGHSAEALEELQDKLHLSKIPHRIECYDISNLQGTNAVASRVVFVDGAPEKSLYRHYKIQTIESQNDFAMMKEVLGRRFSKREEALPDLVVVDGGKGQLAQAVAVLEELEVQGVASVGLAKARVERDFKSKEVRSSPERVFIFGRKNPVVLKPGTGAFVLLTHLRDEAHRFAVNYHRKLRGG